MIDLEAIIALEAVDTDGSVVAAATSLGYTPSAISQQIKRLERSTGVQLLERAGRGVILTTAGRQLVDDGKRLLADMEQLESALHRRAEQVTGHLRLCAFSTAVRGVVAPALPRLLARHPDLTIGVHESEPWETIERVATGRCDLGLVHLWGDVALEIPDHVVSTHVGRDVADVLVPSGHRLAARTRVTPADLVDEPWIATGIDTICRQWLVRMHVGLPRPPRIAHQVGEFESQIALVAAGLGIALIPRLGRAHLPPTIRAVEVHRPVPSRDLLVLHRRSAAASPAVAAATEALRAACG